MKASNEGLADVGCSDAIRIHDAVAELHTAVVGEALPPASPVIRQSQVNRLANWKRHRCEFPFDEIVEILERAIAPVGLASVGGSAT